MPACVNDRHRLRMLAQQALFLAGNDLVRVAVHVDLAALRVGVPAPGLQGQGCSAMKGGGKVVGHRMLTGPQKIWHTL
jgi:hypothetical protein